MAARDVTWSRWNRDWWDWQGACGGIVVGVVFILVELAATALRLGGADLFRPFRLRAAIVLGPEVLDPPTRLGSSRVTGTLVRLALAAFLGLSFGAFADTRRWLARSPGVLVLATAGYGLALWLANYCAAAPTVGWSWFPEETDRLVHVPAHALGLGIPLGVYLNRAAALRRYLGFVERWTLRRAMRSPARPALRGPPGGSGLPAHGDAG